MSSQTTPAAESPSSPTATSPSQNPITAPGLRIRSGSPTPSPEPTTAPTSDPIDETTTEDPIDSAGIPSQDPAEQHPIKLGKRSFAEIARGVVASASLYVHGFFARTEAAQQSGVWIADENDQAQIGDPLAAIAARHGVPATAGSKDTADLISAAVGLAAYLAKNIKLALALRAHARRAAAEQPEPAPEP